MKKKENTPKYVLHFLKKNCFLIFWEMEISGQKLLNFLEKVFLLF